MVIRKRFCCQRNIVGNFVLIPDGYAVGDFFTSIAFTKGGWMLRKRCACQGQCCVSACNGVGKKAVG